MKKIEIWLVCVWMIAGLLVGTRLASASIPTKTIADGMAARMSSVQPRQLDLLDSKPDNITKMPNGVDSPQFGVLTLGPQEKPTSFTVMMDGAITGAPHVWIDANANNDLTDDPPIVWKAEPYKGFDGRQLTLYRGGVTLQVRYGKHITPLHLTLLRYDLNDPNRGEYRNTLLFVADYAREADITLGAIKYHVMFYDVKASGDFRGQRDQPLSNIALMIDVNHNEQFDPRGEVFDAWHPFNIKGTTYEIANMTPDGLSFDVVKSKVNVKEIPPPPDLRIGKVAPAFTRKTLTGAAVHFPADYKGRLVLLYFWGSWCPDCQSELPNVKQVYAELHPKGLEMLGVSVDADKQAVPFTTFYTQNKLTWPQIYDGRYWSNDIVQLYFVQTVPSPYLVDGNTGKILASGDNLKGTNLAQTIKKFLAERK